MYIVGGKQFIEETSPGPLIRRELRVIMVDTSSYCGVIIC
jgi:hypothetical protein